MADLGQDLRAAGWISDKAQADYYAQNLYAALCNMPWQHCDIWSILTNKTWACSWRSAGALVSDLRQQGDYMDWYCSGMGGIAGYDVDPDYYARMNYVQEGTVTGEIRCDLRALGWAPAPHLMRGQPHV
jgi:hypothetical protein